tara:strand:+ start:124 stop:660 length:537 start_codon:yes stop_codon:yes gene_type:complete
MAFNFNDRGIGVVDYHSGGRSYSTKKTGEAPGTITSSALKRADKQLAIISNQDDILSSNAGEYRKELLSFLDGSLFLITANARTLAIAIYHLYKHNYFVITDTDININNDFRFKPEMFDINENSDLRLMIDTLRESSSYEKRKDNKNSVSYNRFLLKTVATILRYERYIIDYLDQEFT